MIPMLPNPRYERKFVADGLALAEVLALVRRHPAAFREAYPPRFVNNIYLDSHGRSDYHDNIAGVANRSKTRVRWYGPLSGQIAEPVLERKLKRGLISGKLTHALPGFAANGGMIQPLLKSAFEAALLPERLRFDLSQREPSLFNRYRRYYFLSGDGRFRLTVDTELQCGRGSASNGLRATLTPCAPTQILELKFGPSEVEQADRVTNFLPFRLARCSKYVLGIGRLG
jgi:VTC domain